MRIAAGLRRALIVFGLLGVTATSVSLRAEMLPLWEAGAGIGVLSLPDYRGSDERRTYVLPVPYFVYRGEIFKADREGVRGVLFDGRRVELDLSAALSPPVESEKNNARRGMADLDPVAELGPDLEILLWEGSESRLKFKAPVRAAFTLSGSPKGVGWVFSPRLNYDLDSVAGSGWRMGLLAGPIYATRTNHAYYYSVSAAEATAARPRYEAPGGYSGTQFLMSLSKRFRRTWVGAFVRWDTLAGAAFVDSPLVRQRSYLAGGVAVSWVFGESVQRVEATP